MSAADKVVLVVGDTGAGKTTLVRLLSDTNFGDANGGAEVRGPLQSVYVTLCALTRSLSADSDTRHQRCVCALDGPC